MNLEKTSAGQFPTLKIFLTCGAFVLFGLYLSRSFVKPLGHDQSSYLFEAQRMLQGFEPYGPHLTEVSPPVIIWFSALPVLLSHWLHASPVFFFRLLVIALIFGSVGWCAKILQRNPAFSDPISVALLSFTILAIEFSTGTYDSGQREHLLIILLLPYILATLTGATNRLSVAERCALGVAAGIAIWFKPQQTLILVALELFLAVRARSLRRIFAPEFLALLLASLLILGLVRLIAPKYFSVTIPLLVDTYWAFGTNSTLDLALSLKRYMLFVLWLLLICYFLRSSLRDPATTIGLLVCSIAASFAFDIQHTIWGYHLYPHQALFNLAFAYLFIDLLHPAIIRFSSNTHLVRWSLIAASCGMAVLLCAVAIHPRLVLADAKGNQGDDLDHFLTRYNPSTTVTIYSTGEGGLYHAYNHGFVWGSRFAHLWMLPAIIQNELGPTGPPAPFKRLSSQRLATLSDLQRNEAAEDLNYWKPAVVLVEQCSVANPCQGIEGKNFDEMAWFQQSPEFTEAWSHYQRQPEAPPSYNLYTRIKEQPTNNNQHPTTNN